MKFISKSTNLHIILQSALPEQPLTGFAGRPGISVRFRDGVAHVDDEKIIQMMLKHNGFNRDFISSEDTGGIDPYAYNRQESEPAHTITEMKYGMPEKRTIGGQKVNMTPEMRKAIQETAIDMAKAMLPGMLEEALKKIVRDHEAEKNNSATQDPTETVTPTPVKRGRPKKVTA